VPVVEIDAGEQPPTGVALSADASRLYVMSAIESPNPMRQAVLAELTVYDVARGEVVDRASFAGSPAGLAISRDGATLAMPVGGEVVLLDAANLHERARFAGEWGALEFSNDGSLLAATSGPDGSAVVLDATTGGERLRLPSAADIAFSPDDATLYSITAHPSSAGELSVWDLAGDRRFVELVHQASADPFFQSDENFWEGRSLGPQSPLGRPDLAAPDGEAVAYPPPGTQERLLRLLDTADHELSEPIQLGQPPTAFAWRPPAFDVLAVAGIDGQVQMIDRRTGDVIAERTLPGRAILALAFTPEGDRVIVGRSSGTLSVLDATTLEPAGASADMEARILDVLPTADGTRAAVLIAGTESLGWRGERYALVDLATGTVVEDTGLGFTHAAAAVSPDGTRLAVAGTTGVVALRALDRRGWVRPPVGALHRVVRTVSYAPDGTAFVATDADGWVKLFDGATGELLAQLVPGHPGVTASAVFQPDGHTVLVATGEGDLYRWDTRLERAVEFACTLAGRQLTPAEWAEAFPERPYRQTCPAG
jgi:WD40 repeat protein